MTKCPRCSGTGKLRDPHTTGAAMRKRRLRTRVSMRQVARVMGYSVPYLSDLERGFRGWNDNLRDRYVRALEASNA